MSAAGRIFKASCVFKFVVLLVYLYSGDSIVKPFCDNASLITCADGAWLAFGVTMILIYLTSWLIFPAYTVGGLIFVIVKLEWKPLLLLLVAWYAFLKFDQAMPRHKDDHNELEKRPHACCPTIPWRLLIIPFIMWPVYIIFLHYCDGSACGMWLCADHCRALQSEAWEKTFSRQASFAISVLYLTVAWSKVDYPYLLNEWAAYIFYGIDVFVICSAIFWHTPIWLRMVVLYVTLLYIRVANVLQQVGAKNLTEPLGST
mmetsp:Transcript_124725/g.240687  ORF Transcript_124725/g.240687 Transcript_124725/m.240687 type:complete len:259 (-) Transcript_124725:44-820(-)